MYFVDDHVVDRDRSLVVENGDRTKRIDKGRGVTTSRERNLDEELLVVFNDLVAVDGERYVVQ